MSLQQVHSSPGGQFGRRLPATATVQAADELLRPREPSTPDRIRLPYGEFRFIDVRYDPEGRNRQHRASLLCN
jgi:hypothetical protein